MKGLAQQQAYGPVIHLTRGHCVPGAFLDAGVTVVNEADKISLCSRTLQSSNQPAKQTVRATSIYVKSGIAHQYILIDKLRPT